MTPQQIKDSAPEGSTHYTIWWAEISDTEYTIYFKYENGILYEILGGKWDRSLYNIDQVKPL